MMRCVRARSWSLDQGLPDMSRAIPNDEVITPRYAPSTILLDWIVAVLIVVVGGPGLADNLVGRMQDRPLCSAR